MQFLIDTFGLTKPVTEIVLRSAIAFLALVILVRVVPKRNAGHISPNDMLILIVIGTMGADAITGGTESVGDILIMIVLVLLLGYLLDICEFRVPGLRKILRHPPTSIVSDGRMLRRNMRQELITEDELMATLRREGLESLSSVKSATVEADGEISIIRKGGVGQE